MRSAILGPVLADLETIGLHQDEVVVASAFYSATRLRELSITADRVDLLVRLDTSSPTDWIGGGIAPDALLSFISRQCEHSSRVRLFCSAVAHAKVYLGSRAFLVGSANLTVRGLAGLSSEILWREDDPRALRRMSVALGRYTDGLRQVQIEELDTFVNRYAGHVRAARQRLSRARATSLGAEDMIPSGVRLRAPRLGDFEGFLSWLAGRHGDAEQLILRRARGEGQLSGHIRRNFFGLRQFLIAYPRKMRQLTTVNPESYTLHNDAQTQTLLRDFVRREAVDEADLSVDTWRTYLPESAGGKPKTGGGTSGNLKRMLPLVAQYLRGRLR